MLSEARRPSTKQPIYVRYWQRQWVGDSSSPPEDTFGHWGLPAVNDTVRVYLTRAADDGFATDNQDGGLNVVLGDGFPSLKGESVKLEDPAIHGPCEPRLNGMRAAIKDLESGLLKQVEYPAHAFLQSAADEELRCRPILRIRRGNYIAEFTSGFTDRSICVNLVAAAWFVYARSMVCDGQLFRRWRFVCAGWHLLSILLRPLILLRAEQLNTTLRIAHTQLNRRQRSCRSCQKYGQYRFTRRRTHSCNELQLAPSPSQQQY